MSIGLCLKCPHRTQVCAGPCPCTIDGRDIIDHATAGDCPKGFFTEPEKMPPRPATAPVAGPPPRPDIPLAGDVVEAIAKRIGADRLAKLWEKWTGKGCGCGARKEAMNRATERLLKWWGRTTNRPAPPDAAESAA